MHVHNRKATQHTYVRTELQISFSLPGQGILQHRLYIYPLPPSLFTCNVVYLFPERCLSKQSILIVKLIFFSFHESSFLAFDKTTFLGISWNSFSWHSKNLVFLAFREMFSWHTSKLFFLVFHETICLVKIKNKNKTCSWIPFQYVGSSRKKNESRQQFETSLDFKFLK